MSENETPMIDPHGDAEDVINDVPELSVEEVEKRIGARERARRQRVPTATPARIRTAPSNRRAVLWRDSATILIFVVIALLAARLLLGGSDSNVATASPTPPPSGIEVTEVPGSSGFLFTPLPTLGDVVNPSSRINATPTPIPVITPAPPTPPGNVTAVAGNQAADVSWSAPLSNGGSEIKTYVVTSSPGGKTCSAATGIHHCTVSHLTNGTSYTFTVTATNSVGTSPSSAPSNAVVPSTTPTKTPGPTTKPGATPTPPPTAPPPGPPTASFTFSPCTAGGGFVVDFNAGASTAGSGGGTLSYDWNFDLGGIGTGVAPSHDYSSTGAQTYTVILTVTQSIGGAQDAVPHDVVCTP